MAFCTHCGHNISELAVSCPACGHPNRAASVAVLPQRRTSGLAIVALVLGITSVLFPVFLVPSVLAILFAVRAKREMAVDPTLGGRGIATAAQVLAGVGLLYAIVFKAFTVSVSRII